MAAHTGQAGEESISVWLAQRAGGDKWQGVMLEE